MVERVIGRNPNFEIIFEKQENESWVATVPSNLLGEYYIDLYAYDMAGNVAYMSKALFTVDVNSIHIHLLKDIFELDSQDNNDIKMTVSYAEDFECSVKEVLPCIANV